MVGGYFLTRWLFIRKMFAKKVLNLNKMTCDDCQICLFPVSLSESEG